MKREKGFRVVTDWAGVKNGRQSSNLSFSKANELARKVVSFGKLTASVYYGDFADELIVRYVTGPDGTAIVAEVGRS